MQAHGYIGSPGVDGYAFILDAAAVILAPEDAHLVPQLFQFSDDCRRVLRPKGCSARPSRLTAPWSPVEQCPISSATFIIRVNNDYLEVACTTGGTTTTSGVDWDQETL